MANEILYIENFPQGNVAEASVITVDAEAAQKTVTLENVDGFVANKFVLVGEKGAETSEVGQVDTINGKIVTLKANLVNKHYKNEPVYVVNNDRAKIYKTANVDGSVPADGAFSILATIVLEGDQVFTTYSDTNGGAGYWYKYTFYNSFTTAETPIGDAVAVRGGNFGHYVTTDMVREEAGLQNNRWITDNTIFEKLIAAESEVNASLLIAGYELPFTEVPALIVNATRLLAAGYLLSMDYGPEFNGTNKDGAGKIKMARDILAQIEAGSPLVISTGIITSDTSVLVKGYPDDTANDETYGEPRYFTQRDKF